MLKLVAKSIVLVCLVALLAVGCQNLRLSGDPTVPAVPEGAVRLGTYNVHYIILGQDSGAWSEGDWERRKRPMDAAFKTLDADVMAFQEMESFRRGGDGSVNLARDWLAERNPDYAVAASGPWETFPPTQPMLYRSARLDLLEDGWFFFSDTPDVIYSRTFNGSYPAFASWARFRDRDSGKAFRVVNIHTDFRSAGNRLKSMDLVARRIAPWQDAGETVFVLGDFNALSGAPTLEILSDAGLSYARVPGATYHLNRGLNLFGAIDHVAFTDGVEVANGPFVLRRKFYDEWPSDHYPVVVDVTLP